MFKQYRVHGEDSLVTINLAQVKYITWGNGTACVYMKEGLLITPETTRLRQHIQEYNKINGYGGLL